MTCVGLSLPRGEKIGEEPGRLELILELCPWQRERLGFPGRGNHQERKRDERCWRKRGDFFSESVSKELVVTRGAEDEAGWAASGKGRDVCASAGRRSEHTPSLYHLIASERSQSLRHVKIASDFSCVRGVQRTLAGFPRASAVRLAGDTSARRLCSTAPSLSSGPRGEARASSPCGDGGGPGARAGTGDVVRPGLPLRPWPTAPHESRVQPRSEHKGTAEARSGGDGTSSARPPQRRASAGAELGAGGEIRADGFQVSDDVRRLRNLSF